VGMQRSPLRAAFARDLAAEPRTGPMAVIEGDFYAEDIPGPFDVVGYWDGFGVGGDADQRRLLRRVASEWLGPGGSMLVDVYNPFAWARLAGQEHLDEEINAMQARDFDPAGCRFIDRWWPAGDESRPVAQSIRCYTPADFLLLVEGTGLAVRSLEVDGQRVDAMAGGRGMDGPLADALRYLAHLGPERSRYRSTFTSTPLDGKRRSNVKITASRDARAAAQSKASAKDTRPEPRHNESA